MSVEILSWEEISSRLTKIMHATPYAGIHARDPCALASIRLRDIAEYCRIEPKNLYRIRRGERLLHDRPQRELSWFFHALDQGRLVKELGPDGKYHIRSRNPQPQVHADEAHARPSSYAATVDFLNAKVRWER